MDLDPTWTASLSLPPHPLLRRPSRAAAPTLLPPSSAGGGREHRVAVDLVRRWPERTPPPLREPAVARARATLAPRARGSPAAPRLASPRLHCERPARARAKGAEGEEWRRRWGRLASPPLRDGGSRGGRMPAAMAPRRTGLTAELGCGRARAGGAQAGTARTARRPSY